MHLDYCKNKIKIFIFFPFPIGYKEGLKIDFKIFLKGIFVQEGSSETRSDHGQFEIKTFLIYALPYFVI